MSNVLIDRIILSLKNSLQSFNERVQMVLAYFVYLNCYIFPLKPWLVLLVVSRLPHISFQRNSSFTCHKHKYWKNGLLKYFSYSLRCPCKDSLTILLWHQLGIYYRDWGRKIGILRRHVHIVWYIFEPKPKIKIKV